MESSGSKRIAASKGDVTLAGDHRKKPAEARTKNETERKSVAHTRVSGVQSRLPIRKDKKNTCIPTLKPETIKPKKSELSKSSGKSTFEQDFLQKHNFDKRLRIDEKRLLETDIDYVSDAEKPVERKYSKKVSELEKRWSGEFLDLTNNRRNSSESSSKSSYVEEIGSVSSVESIGHPDRKLVSFQGCSNAISTPGSDNSRRTEEQSDSVARGEPVKTDGYANLIKEFSNMEGTSSRLKKEEKHQQKKKSGFRRLLPAFLSPKDYNRTSNKDYGGSSKKEKQERRKQDDQRHFARYQKSGNYTRSPDTLNLNDDISRNVQLNTSLNGSMIEERLDEIKRELFPDQGLLVTSTPDHFSPGRSYETASIDRRVPDHHHHQQQQQQQMRRYGMLERKHSLQEHNPNARNLFFMRNHAPSGRISAPPNERFILRPRAIHPIDRPLPAIPHSRLDLSDYANYQHQEIHQYLNQSPFYENGQQNAKRGQSTGKSSKYSSPGSSQKSGDYADSSFTPNSSQKSEFSPSSSKSGEYYLNSPRDGSLLAEEISPNIDNQRSPDQSFRSENSRSCDADEKENRPIVTQKLRVSNCSPASMASTSSPNLRGNSRQASPVHGPLCSSQRKSQPNDQILIASPIKRDLSRTPTSLHESSDCVAISAVDQPQSVVQRVEAPTRPETMNENRCDGTQMQEEPSSAPPQTSPVSKKQTLQNLEAFYWHSQIRRNSPPVSSAPGHPSNFSQAAGLRRDSPDLREAVYWHQLKKLDEEQQRRIYQQNLLAGRRKTLKQGEGEAEGKKPMGRYWSTKLQEGTKVNNPTGKPPLMQSQKVQHQPVLIVRPQQQPIEKASIIFRELPRSKSASPHLAPAPTAPNSIEEEPAPAPIFKRGSLIGSEAADYGSTGPKRVSFSSQSNTGQEMPRSSGKWPTKNGIAPEPPTRRHRSEDECPYGNLSSWTCDTSLSPEVHRQYDANKPLPALPPPPPTPPTTTKIKGPPPVIWMPPRRTIILGPNPPAENPYDSHDRPSFADGREEEWNPDGKGRQCNDIGGPVRVEGDLPNELTGGRRGGGGGGGGGGGNSVGGGVLGVGAGGRSGGGGRSRDEPRRHTLGGDHQPSLHHQQFNAAQQLHPLHPHHLPPPHGQYGAPATRHTSMDLEMGTKSRQRKSPLPRGYPPPSSAMLFDDDPGIMSEVETSSTGFRRGNKQRSSLPVVRTPSKTLERPLGLVFLQYRNETKRALLPNEITSIDTVKALFVRSFPKQLTMEYLDSPHVKVYIHDSNKDMFYELEDLRSHLRDIRDRSVLRLFESSDGVTGMPGPLGVPGCGGAGIPPHWEDQSYFSEPEFDSEYQHQHIHKSKTAKNSSDSYYVGGSRTLPRGASLLRAYSPAASSIISGPNATPSTPKSLAAPDGWIGAHCVGVPQGKPFRSLGGSARFSRDSSISLCSIPADRLHGESGYMSSPERVGGVGSAAGRYPSGPYSAGSSYEDPYYSQYSGTVTPVIDEEASDTELLEESYGLYGVKPPSRPPSGPPRSPFPSGGPASLPPGGPSYDVTRIRVEHMERQLANLTGLVQKALTHAPHTSPSPRDYLQVPAGRDPYARAADDSYLRTDAKPPKLGKDKSVSFEKSVSFSDEPPDMNSPKQHSPQHAADTKPTKPAIKSSTLPRMSSQERDSRHKPTPPPKPAALVTGQYVYRDLALTPEMYNQLRGLQKKAKDLRQEVRNLRRMSQAQAHTVRETIRDTFITIRAMLLSGIDANWSTEDAEKIRLSREADLYKQEMIRLEKDLTELESTVEELRGNVINRKTRVNMSDVENMALILSKSSKTVADLKVRFPNLQDSMKGLLSSEMEKAMREEKFLKEEPERLESALRRCKKLTGTLVTLKRLASVQEQRLPNSASVDAEETPPITPTSAQHSKAAAPVPAERTIMGSASVLGGGPHLVVDASSTHQQRPENALDALLDELQTFSRPSSSLSCASTGPTSAVGPVTRPPNISNIGRKGSVDSSCGPLIGEAAPLAGGLPPGAVTNAVPVGSSGTLRRLHSYPSSSDTDTSPPIARIQVSQLDAAHAAGPAAPVAGQKPPVPERKAELLQLASAKRVPPPPPPRTSSRSPLASPTSPQLPPRSHPSGGGTSTLQQQNNNNSTLRRPAARAGSLPAKEGKPPMALPPEANNALPSEAAPCNNGGPAAPHVNYPVNNCTSVVLSASNSSSCESVNSQEGVQSKRSRQELDQRHQELLRQQKALQEQFARLQQLQRNTAGRTTVPPAPPDLKKTGSESNLLAKTGFIGLSTASSGSWANLNLKTAVSVDNSNIPNSAAEVTNGANPMTTIATTTANSDSIATTTSTIISVSSIAAPGATTTSKIYETDIL
ncbi:uncharacterized protein [Prorops nasuta]|uniref:uncharacterized protein isoform X4 n=1 Tax=Prorops nasuta TaxID=863751 RepID=UPI0034CD4688